MTDSWYAVRWLPDPMDLPVEVAVRARSAHHACARVRGMMEILGNPGVTLSAERSGRELLDQIHGFA